MVCLDTGVAPIPFVFSSPSVPGDPGDKLENKPDWLDPGGVVRREGDPCVGELVSGRGMVPV